MTESMAIRICLKDRNPLGFEYLVRKFRREAYMHAMILLGNREDAADACQESFARAFVAMPRLESLDSFYPWFYRILKNCCLNMIAKRKTISRHKDDLGSEVANPDPDILLEKQEEQLKVWSVLESLSLDHREILVMKYIRGCCYKDISRILDIPRGTVMSRLYNARKAFQEKYLQMEKQSISTRRNYHERL